tara:strand:+ start:89 stop:244 length:156 start_codon:yes stop_codon:yes gene_type:complete
MKYKNVSIGITRIQEKYSFFVVDKNVTWHPCIMFKTQQTAEIAAKEYVEKI